MWKTFKIFCKNGKFHVAEHHRLPNHTIDWDSAQSLTYSTNYFQRLTLEIWFTNLEQIPLNRCQPIPAPYKRLIHDINITNEPNFTNGRDWPITTDLRHLSLTANNIAAKSTNQFKQTGLRTFDWQHLFTWLWWWLPLRLSKRQSPLPTTVLLRTTLTRTIKLHYYEKFSLGHSWELKG